MQPPVLNWPGTIGLGASLLTTLAVTVVLQPDRGPGSGRRQAVPTTTIGDSVVELPEPFAKVLGVRGLPNGRAVVADECEESVFLVDFSAATRRPIGRRGRGPHEFGSVGSPVPLPGDSTLVQDRLNRRFLVLGPDGTPKRSYPELPPVIKRGLGGLVGLDFRPTASDGAGRLYSSEDPLRFAAGFVLADSVPIERWDPATGRRDTVSFLRTGSPGAASSRGPWPYRDQAGWAVADDGRVAIVSPADYHVDFVDRSGSRLSGPPNRWSPAPLTLTHRQQWLAERDFECAGGGGPRTTGEGWPIRARQRRVTEAPEWPATLPPFDAAGIRFDERGTLWVRRYLPRPAGEVYDLVDRRGAVFHRIRFPEAVRLIGFGSGAVLATRTDDSGLQYLLRYPYPAL